MKNGTIIQTSMQCHWVIKTLHNIIHIGMLHKLFMATNVPQDDLVGQRMDN